MKYLKLLAGLLVILLITIGISPSLFAKTDLEKAAFKEGKVNWYSGVPLPLSQKIASAFKTHYPEIEVNLYRSGASKLAAKISAEKETGKLLADVICFASPAVWLDFKKKGWLEKYMPEEYQKFGENFRDPDGYWATPRVYVVGVWYNVEGLKKAGLDPPPSWKSLTDAKYKGKLVLASPLYSGTYLDLVGYFAHAPGWGWDYWKKIFANDPLLINDVPDVARTVSAGQRDIGITVWGYISMFPLYPKGTVKVVIPEEGTTVLQCPSGILKGRPNTNAGKLFQKFLLSKEVGEMITADFYYSGRTDVAPAPGKIPLQEIKAFTTDSVWVMNNARQIQRTWTELTGQKK